MSSSRDRSVLCFAAWGLLLMAAAGCRPAPADSASAEPPASAAPSVSIVHPEKAMLHREVSQPGFIQAFEETPIFARVAGYVQKWKVDRGDRIERDQVLAELWAPELEVAVGEKEALLLQTQAEIKQAREALTAAEAAFHSAEARVTEVEAKYQGAEARHRRQKSQAERLTGMRNVIERENIEEAQLGFQTATANLAEADAAVKSARAMQREARARWSRAQADVAVVEARLAVARKQRDYAQTMADYARLQAPYQGVVTDRSINTRDFVQPPAGEKARPLYVVMRTDLMRVFVQAPETDADWVVPGVAARVRVQALPGREFSGKVKRTAWALDPATRTLLTEIDLPNRDGPLRPGMYVYATLTAEQPGGLTVPRSAVLTEGDVTRGYQSYCYQVKDGVAHRLEVQIGGGDGERIQILKKQQRPASLGATPHWVDFTGTEDLARDGLKGLSDGCPVTVASGP